jgi:serine/threonine-protein kinase
VAETANDHPSRREHRLDEAIAAITKALEAGQPLDRGAWLARYADLADELAAFLDGVAGPDGRAAATPAPDPEPATLAPASAPSPPDALDILGRFGDYELLAEIARGGMGVVYKARQLSLNRTVALKMILAGQLASAAEVQRFRSEAEAAAAL